MSSDFDSFDASALGDFVQSPLGDRNGVIGTGRMVIAIFFPVAQSYLNNALGFNADANRYRTGANLRNDPLERVLPSTVLRWTSGIPAQYYTAVGGESVGDIFQFLDWGVSSDPSDQPTIATFQQAFEMNANGEQRRWTILWLEEQVASGYPNFITWQNSMEDQGHSFVFRSFTFSHLDWLQSCAEHLESVFPPTH